MSPADLPPVNAALNALSAILLGLGHHFIRQRNVEAHRRCMVSAFVTSVLFLVCYITYHTYLAYVLHKGPTTFREPAGFRPIYLFILITHTILALVVVPLAIVTLRRGLQGRFEAHRKIARWTWPVWMYVSVTGVIIYVLLYHVFPQK
jgi:putative membrane protein